MRTSKISIIIKALGVLVLSVGFTMGCSETGDETSSASVYWLNGKCRSADDHEQVVQEACTDVGEYFYDRGLCVERESDRVVSNNLCRNYSQHYWSDGDCFSRQNNKEVNIDFCFDPERPYAARNNSPNGYKNQNQQFINNGYNNNGHNPWYYPRY